MPKSEAEYPIFFISEISQEKSFDVIVLMSNDSFRRYSLNTLPGGVILSTVTTATDEKYAVKLVQTGKNYSYRRWQRIKRNEFFRYIKLFFEVDQKFTEKFLINSQNVELS